MVISTGCFSYTDNETIFFHIGISEVYFIWVEYYDFENMNYTLAIHETTSVWDDIYEDNDDYDSAYPITTGNSYTNLTAIDWDVFMVFVQVNETIMIYLEFSYLVVNTVEFSPELLFTHPANATWETETDLICKLQTLILIKSLVKLTFVFFQNIVDGIPLLPRSLTLEQFALLSRY